MKMMEMNSKNSHGTVEPASLRRLLLICLIPVSLLLVYGLFAPRNVPGRFAFPKQSAADPETARAWRDLYRKAALGKIERLEKEARLSDNGVTITAEDLKQLRSALL